MLLYNKFEHQLLLKHKAYKTIEKNKIIIL